MDIVETTFNSLLEFYIGSCNALDLDDESWLEDNNLLERWDDAIFLCDECGWWAGEDDVWSDWDEKYPDEKLCNQCGGDR